MPHPPDRDLVTALRAGLPPCSGVALGVDRLLMLLADQGIDRGGYLFPLF